MHGILASTPRRTLRAASQPFIPRHARIESSRGVDSRRGAVVGAVSYALVDGDTPRTDRCLGITGATHAPAHCGSEQRARLLARGARNLPTYACPAGATQPGGGGGGGGTAGDAHGREKHPASSRRIWPCQLDRDACTGRPGISHPAVHGVDRRGGRFRRRRHGASR